jgi:hypothetical protein
MVSPGMQRKADVYELSRNLPIYKLIYKRYPLTAVFKESFGYLESLGSVELGFVSEEDLEKSEDIEW